MTREEFKGLSKQEQKQVKADIWTALKEYVAESEEMTANLKILKPSLYGSTRVGVGAPAKYKTLIEKFNKVGDKISEFDIFKELHTGRKETNALIKKGLRSVEPKERKWITFDVENEEYVLKGIGEKAPKNWTGYVPPEIDAEMMEDLI